MHKNIQTVYKSVSDRPYPRTSFFLRLPIPSFFFPSTLNSLFIFKKNCLKGQCLLLVIENTTIHSPAKSFIPLSLALSPKIEEN